ncbi:MAG: hypothetical protein HY319_10105 [Armatimonadetes bacterium]|nr:hypothetical protein [Armatimonadota bacterium]
MNTISAQRHATALLKTLPERGGVEQRLDAARHAADELVEDHPDALPALLARSMASTSVRPMTQEKLLRVGLETCAQSAVGPLAAAALHLAEQGWDDDEKARLLKAGLRSLVNLDDQARAHPFSVALTASEEAAASRAGLEILASGSGDLQQEALTILRSVPDDRPDEAAVLGTAMLEKCADAGVRVLAGKVLGNWSFTRLSPHSRRAALAALLETGPLDGATAVRRLAGSVVKMRQADRPAALKRLFAQGRKVLGGTDLALLDTAKAVCESVPGHCRYHGLDDPAAAVVCSLMSEIGRHERLSGTVLAGVLLRAQDVDGFEAAETNHALLDRAQLLEPDPQWKAAYRAADRLCQMRSYYWKTESLVRMLGGLKDLPSGEDPVTAVVAASELAGTYPSAFDRKRKGLKPLEGDSTVTKLKSFLVGRKAGPVGNDELTQAGLEILATDASSRAMRELADLAHRTLAQGQSLESLDRLFEVVKARDTLASAAAPDRILVDGDTVDVAGIRIRRRADSEPLLKAVQSVGPQTGGGTIS